MNGEEKFMWTIIEIDILIHVVDTKVDNSEKRGGLEALIYMT